MAYPELSGMVQDANPWHLALTFDEPTLLLELQNINTEYIMSRAHAHSQDLCMWLWQNPWRRFCTGAHNS